ncbi:MAG: hypothetical protein M3R35_02775 [Candidatus Eremiobacteraeota bacterium]|nr:hypothetical protein [Candidatus Eremiobacteraeota bacterium]
MERETPHNDEDTQDESTEMERRAGFEPVHDVDPLPPVERAEAVYGDTDMNPNADDQRSAHHAEPDEHV